jgi:hypothetical protein
MVEDQLNAFADDPFGSTWDGIKGTVSGAASVAGYYVGMVGSRFGFSGNFFTNSYSNINNKIDNFVNSSSYNKGVTIGNVASGALATFAVADLIGAGFKNGSSFGAAKAGVQYTKSSLQLGQQMHKAYKLGEVVEGVAIKEFRGIPGIRPDFVDFSTKTIYELKPFNPRAMQQGLNQLNKYQNLFQQKYGGVWKTVLDTY